MGSVFISHASGDKPFVRTLAAELLAEGIPVWLDSWELEVGDSLIDGIYEGIDASSFVIVVLSTQAVASGWVDREINAALSKELQTGRKFLLPVKSDNCVIPLKIADRIYVDFSTQFSKSLTSLVQQLERNGASAVPPPEEKELVCVTFSQGVYLNCSQFEKRRKILAQRQRTSGIKKTQIFVNEEEDYEILKSKLHCRIDNIEADPFYTAKLQSDLNGLLDQVNFLEDKMREGLAMMINHQVAIEAVDWFCRIMRSDIVSKLWMAQIPDSPEISEYGEKWYSVSLFSNRGAAEFFETTEVDPVHVWDNGQSITPYSIWVDSDMTKDLRMEGHYIGPDRVNAGRSWLAVNKYIYPQMLQQFLTNPDGRKMIWNLENAFIGIR